MPVALNCYNHHQKKKQNLQNQKKPKILDKYETEETKNLTTSELQRLVLLEHLELIRLQKARLRENNLINVFSEEIL